MAILFISGINDISTVGADIDDKGNLIHIMDGNCSIHGKLPLKAEVAAYLVLFGKGVKQKGVTFRQTPSLIVNQISDADTHRGALERCAELCAQVAAPVLNKPEHVLQTTRERVSELLQGIPGVIMPKTVRFCPASPDEVFERAGILEFKFPYIVRIAGRHSGESMILVNGKHDYKAMHVFPFDGRDYYLTEYVDYKDDSGLYHKQRIAVIDGEPLLRHSLYNGHWKVHGSSRSYMLERESWAQDQKRTENWDAEVLPKIKPAITEIKARLGLDYFGIDCKVSPGGEMLIFEANANMNILYNPYPEMNARVNLICKRIQELLARLSGEVVI